MNEIQHTIINNYKNIGNYHFIKLKDQRIFVYSFENCFKKFDTLMVFIITTIILLGETFFFTIEK